MLHAHVHAADTLGIDRSASMLGDSAKYEGDGVHFEVQDIAAFAAGPRAATGGHFDVIFANASLQWVPDHEALLEQLSDALADDGQLAFQVPANDDHVSHTIANAIAREAPFADALAGAPDATLRPTLPPERYAEILDQLGFVDCMSGYRCTGITWRRPRKWSSGSRARCSRRTGNGSIPPRYELFVARYRDRLLARRATTALLLPVQANPVRGAPRLTPGVTSPRARPGPSGPAGSAGVGIPRPQDQTGRRQVAVDQDALARPDAPQLVGRRQAAVGNRRGGRAPARRAGRR